MENGEKKTVSRRVIDREVIMRKYHVHIKNFRNLKDVKVTLSPLTILTGENGSGKSTLFKALLFLKHNHDHEAAKKLKYVIDDDINLGGWDQIANDPKKPISIKITEETWGYDHEVEEIYDIDNCPFELNPTEEYAEKMWESFVDEPFVFQQKSKVLDVDIIKTKRFRNTTETRQFDAFEFSFVNSKLSHITISIGKKELAYTLKYAVPPFTGEVELINSVLNEDQTDLFIVIENAKCTRLADPASLQRILSAIAYASVKYDVYPDRFKKIEPFEPTMAIFWNYSLNDDSKFFKYFGLLLHLFTNLEPKDYHICVETLISLAISNGRYLKTWLSEVLSFGTTREVPQPHYFISQITKNTYYQMFSVMRKNEEKTGFYEREVVWHYILKFNSSLEIFELGKRIELVDGDLLSTLNLVTMSNKNILLSEASSGTIQLLPILFALALNPMEKKTFFIQQPELHLHPRLQAQLALLFINNISPEFTNFKNDFAVQARGEKRVFEEEKIKRNSKAHELSIRWGNEQDNDTKGTFFVDYTVPTHLIIETHSEHLLKKLQVLVSQGKTLQLWPEGHCSGEDVKLKDALSIYYFAKDKNGNTKAIEMEMDDNGFFKTETPKGFFDESIELNRQLLLGRN